MDIEVFFNGSSASTYVALLELLPISRQNLHQIKKTPTNNLLSTKQYRYAGMKPNHVGRLIIAEKSEKSMKRTLYNVSACTEMKRRIA